MLTVPNRPHSSVPVGHEAAANVEVRRWGAPPKFDFTPRPHWEIAEGAGILDFQRATKIASTRFALYRGLGARMERALASSFLDTHAANGYTEILPPFIVNTAALTGVGQLPKFAADMFHLEGTDLWLTPTAEVELTSLYREETLDAEVAADQALRLDGVLPLRGRRSRKRHARPEAPAPIPESRNVQVHAAREKVTRSWNRWLPMPSASSRSSACITASCSCARATWASHRRKPTTSRCGSLRPASSWKFPPARIPKRFRRGVPASASSPKAARASSCTRSMARDSPWGAPGSPSSKTISRRMARSLIPEALRPYMGTDRIPAQA